MCQQRIPLRKYCERGRGDENYSLNKKSLTRKKYSEWNEKHQNSINNLEKSRKITTTKKKKKTRNKTKSGVKLLLFAKCRHVEMQFADTETFIIGKFQKQCTTLKKERKGK